MTNREWLIKEMQNMSDEEFAEAIHTPDGAVGKYACRDCIYSQVRECEWCVVGWLKAEHKEKPKLSEAERVVLENLPEEYKWIARDTGEGLYIWGDKGNPKTELIAFNHLFQFIKWSDNEPYEIAELLKGE